MMRVLLLALLLAAPVGVAADEEAARLKEIAKGLAKGGQEVLAPLQDLQSETAARFVLEVIASNRIGGGIKARLAEIVAAWPATAPGRKTLHEWFVKHPNGDDDVLLFFADIHLPETRGQLWSLIDAAKGGPAKLRQPQRVAMAVKGLGYFEDNPEVVVARIASFLAPDFPHVLRACAADALGGMKHAKAVEALIPQVEDTAIGGRAVRSLYRLTGRHFTDAPKPSGATGSRLPGQRVAGSTSRGTRRRILRTSSRCRRW